MSEDDCPFCAIASGEIPSRLVFEREVAIGFLDANPLAEGHTLVIPTAHHQRLQDVPPAQQATLWQGVAELVPAIEAAVGADATTVGVNNGPAAGQEVPHLHVHIIPRFQGDGGGPIHNVAGVAPSVSDTDLDDIADGIRSNLG